MDLATVHKLYETFAGDQWSLLYSGSFPDEHTTRLISLAEHVAGAERPGPARKLAFVLVEAYQNVIRHRQPLQEPIERGAGRSIFAFQSNVRRHLVAAMNPVRPEEAGGLRTLLERIGRNSDLKELKDMFLRRLQGDSTSTRGGAGLGLIEMARRSNNGLKHDLRVMEDGLLLFSLMVSIGGTSEPRYGPLQLHAIQETMRSMDLLLLFKGGMPALVQTELSRLILAEIRPTPARERSISGAIMAALELITAWDDLPEERVIAIARDGEEHILVCGSAMPPARAKEFERFASSLTDLDQRVLERNYREALLVQGNVADHARIGLLDIARRARAPIDMALFPRSNAPLFLIAVRI